MPTLETSSAQIKLWRSEIRKARSADYRKLTQSLNKYLQLKQDTNLATFRKQLETSKKKVHSLRENKPQVTYPSELPISQRRSEIAEFIKNNQVVIVAGETGSGKTTQLPKICLDLGFGCRGLIGHTQPRRIAARTVADRIASELKVPLGETVGYQVRFKDLSTDSTQVKLMTDGVLLAEIQNDRLLSRYEVIIIDEAHERSLNIDFLLGLLKPLCKKRPDLKVIITSATIDLNKFAQHFSMDNTPAPIIEVSGRTYPVETLYQPLVDKAIALEDHITQTVTDLIKGEHEGLYKAQGDILVFCSGERDIRETAKALRKVNLNIDVLPLYARLSVAEQNKVFMPSAKRKVVLATNVAETSITVPGIAYVIDPGLARISRYSFKSKIQRLPIEEISQASANQRQGRCGRVANGICIRLYSEENYKARSEFTPAEILRSNLASVILQMRRLGIKDSQTFDFIDTPDTRLLNDGIKLLQELNAINPKQQLTNIGKQLSVIPVDPRYARILVEANKLGCLRDALIIVSVLSIQDPRERPAEFRQKADEKHKLTQHWQSDFFSYLYLWQLIKNQREELSNAEFKKYCTSHFLSIARIFEWRELYRQLTSICKELNWKLSEWKTLALPDANIQKEKVNTKVQFDSRYINLHKALLSGLLSNIATKTLDNNYVATRNRKVDLFPGSCLFKRPKKQAAKWLLAAEFLETSRSFMLTAAEIEPDWVITAARHLCKYSYSDPHYGKRSGLVQAKRKTLLSGLVLKENERINYAPINPEEAHKLFIQRALVDGLYSYKIKKSGNTNRQLSFSQHNRILIEEIKKLEIKTRKHNLLVSDAEIFSFYAEKVPNTVVSRSTFEKWYKINSEENPKLLFLSKTDLVRDQLRQSELAQFPNTLNVHGKKLKLTYIFDPSSEADGVTLLIPYTLLEPFPENVGSWLVPGLLQEKCIALLKTLPKILRKKLVPISNTIESVMPDLKQSEISLENALCQQVLRATAVNIKPSDFDRSKLDNYYLMNYRIIKSDGSQLAQNRDLLTLKNRYASTIKNSIAKKSEDEKERFEIHNINTWNFGDLKESVKYQHQGMQITAFPMLQIQDDLSISLLLSYNKDLASFHSKQALIKLTQQQKINGNQKQSYQYLLKELFKEHPKQDNSKKKSSKNSSLAHQLKAMKSKNTTNANIDSFAAWIKPVMDAAIWQTCFSELNDLPRNQTEYENALRNSRQWVSNALAFEKVLLDNLHYRQRLLKKLKALKNNNTEIRKTVLDIRSQLDDLFEDDILNYTKLEQLKHYSRYLKAIEHRIDKIYIQRSNTSEIEQLYSIQEKFSNRIQQQLEELNNGQSEQRALKLAALYYVQPNYFDFAVLMQEWRVSIFAQHLKTRVPVSYKRIKKSFDALNLN